MADDDWTMSLRISEKTCPRAKKWLLEMPSGARQAAIRAVLEEHLARQETSSSTVQPAPIDPKGWGGLKDDTPEKKTGALEQRIDLDFE